MSQQELCPPVPQLVKFGRRLVEGAIATTIISFFASTSSHLVFPQSPAVSFPQPQQITLNLAESH